jgi:hypothetical protein
MERWAQIEAELIDRHAGSHNATGLALLDACKMIAALEAENDKLVDRIRELDLDFQVKE